MPLYEYQCTRCGRRFEQLQKLSDPPVTECPACGGPVEKLVSSPAFQFKGTGWYVTDYARKGEGTSSSASDSKEASVKDAPAKDGPAKDATKPADKSGEKSSGDTKSAGESSSKPATDKPKG